MCVCVCVCVRSDESEDEEFAYLEKTILSNDIICEVTDEEM